MTTPARLALAELNRELAARGQTVVLRRPASPSSIDVTLRAFVRAVGAMELMAGVATAGDLLVIVSASGIGTWPGGSGEVPKRGDVVVIAGYEAAVQHAKPVRLADQLIRVDLVVSGRVG